VAVVRHMQCTTCGCLVGRFIVVGWKKRCAPGWKGVRMVGQRHRVRAIGVYPMLVRPLDNTTIIGIPCCYAHGEGNEPVLLFLT
jgi:hypothetical protein